MGIETVPDDVDLVAFVERLDVSAGTWVTGVGTLTDVVLNVPGADGNEVSREFPGKAALVGLAGPASGPLMATLAGPAALAGGRLLSGRAAGVTLFVQEPTQAANAARGRPAAVTASRPELDAPDDEAEEAPKYGDRVDHFVFGLCDVMVVREERMKIRNAGGGKLREIHLRAVKVLKPVEQDGHRVFKLVRRGG